MAGPRGLLRPCLLQLANKGFICMFKTQGVSHVDIFGETIKDCVVNINFLYVLFVSDGKGEDKLNNLEICLKVITTIIFMKAVLQVGPYIGSILVFLDLEQTIATNNCYVRC